MTQHSDNRDLAGKEHWNRSERNTDVALHAFGPRAGVRNYAKRLWHEAFRRTFANLGAGDKSLLELGCGGSAFLPYFAAEYGFKVHGIDYSEGGCTLARRMCDTNRVPATIVCADFFHPPPETIGSFDAVVSFGVLEHFANTAETVKAFRRFLRPGGLLLTVVPNMGGLAGAAQKLLCRRVFDVHEVITPERLREAHGNAGLSILENDYFLFVNFGVTNIGENPSIVRRAALESLRATTGAVWAVESMFGSMAPNSVTSPYVWCVARVPTDARPV